MLQKRKNAQMFELMIEDVLTDVQPQTEHEWRERERESLEVLQETESRLFPEAGVYQMQLVMGRSPEIPGDRNSDNPDVIANLSIFHYRGAGQSKR